jgi:hypothetical protein
MYTTNRIAILTGLLAYLVPKNLDFNRRVLDFFGRDRQTMFHQWFHRQAQFEQQVNMNNESLTNTAEQLVKAATLRFKEEANSATSKETAEAIEAFSKATVVAITSGNETLENLKKEVVTVKENVEAIKVSSQATADIINKLTGEVEDLKRNLAE